MSALLSRLLARSSARARRSLARVWLVLGMLGCCVPTASAATYTYRSDAYAWESAATQVTWDRACTNYAGDDDKATLSLSGGFKIPFAGKSYSSVIVHSNGAVQFGADTGFHRAYDNTALPADPVSGNSSCAGGTPTNVLMPYWTDLNPSATGSGKVWWEQKGSAPNRYLVVSWSGVYEYSTKTPYSVQVILYENGEFKYQYGNTNATGSNATIGVQVSASDYTLYAYNSGYNTGGTAIRWFQPSGTPKRLAEYRMDESSWSGKVGEVADSSGNGYGGVQVGAASNSADGKVCRALSVPANTSSTVAGIDTGLNVAASIGAEGSVSFWYRANSAWLTGADAQLLDATASSGRSFHLARRSQRHAAFRGQRQRRHRTQCRHPGAAGPGLDLGAPDCHLAPGQRQQPERAAPLRERRALGHPHRHDHRQHRLAPEHPAAGRQPRRHHQQRRHVELGQRPDRRGAHLQLRSQHRRHRTGHRQHPRVAHHHLHHLEIRHDTGTGVTCAPSTLTVTACQDAACSAPYTGGLTATLGSSGGTVLWPATSAIVIPAGSSSTTVPMQLVTAGSTVLGSTLSLPAASAATSCNFGTPACTFTAADSGLIASVAAHVAGTDQALTLQAVRKSDSSAQCVPLLAGLTRGIGIGCSYANPGSGSLTPRIGGTSLAACNGTKALLNLAFDAGGIARTTLNYPDAGQVSLALSYVGSALTKDLGLTLLGDASFIAAPAALAFKDLPTTAVKAGTAFTGSLVALNAAGATTPNFGRESPTVAITLAHTLREPTGSGAVPGSFSGTVGTASGGVLPLSQLVWTEVGRIDLGASLSNYLGSGLNVSGSSAAADAVRSIPHHFDLALTPACSGAFTYSGQPFAVTAIARNGQATPAITRNYDGSNATSPKFARSLALSDAQSLGGGSFSGGIDASAFVAGIAAVNNPATGPAYTFTDKLSEPRTLVLRGSDSDGVSSAAGAEPSLLLRSGRLRLFNTFGSEKADLVMPVQAQYWSGKAWVLNDADSCSLVPQTAIGRTQFLDHKGAVTAAWAGTDVGFSVVAGHGQLTVPKPPAGTVGSIDIALNLGAAVPGLDASCLSTHATTTGAGLPWLRARHGNCAAGWAGDPWARVTFGVDGSAELRRSVHVREIY